MNVAPPPPVEPGIAPPPARLHEVLDGLAARHLRLASISGAGAAAAGLLAGLFVLGWIDLLADLPGGVRLGGLVLLALAAAVVAAAAVMSGRRECRPERLAARIDRHGATGGIVLAGVELEAAAPFLKDPVTRDLSLAAAGHAGVAAGEHSPATVLPAAPARRPWWAAAGVGAVLAVLAAIWPPLFTCQALRLLDPLGDHPPYSPYSFAVRPGGARIFYGDPFSIQVSVRGDVLPDRVEWVVEADGEKPVLVPLLDQGGGNYVGALGSVVNPFLYYVRGREGRSIRYTVQVVTTPRIDAVEILVEPPAYTRRPPFRGPYPEGGIIGVRGTRVTMFAVSNRPLGGGRLTWKPPPGAAAFADVAPPPIPLRPAPPEKEGEGGRAAGTFEISGDTDLEITVADAGGVECREPFRGRVMLLPDRRPTVTILEPSPESYATPDATVPLVVEAEDDFGLTRVEIVRSLNGTRDHARALDLGDGEANPARLTDGFPLAEWGLEPGDVLEFYATAADNDPAGAKTGQSKVHRLRIISEEEYRRALRTRQTIEALTERYRPVGEALDRAREEMKELREARAEEAKAAPGSPEAEAARKRAEEALTRLREALDEAAKLAREQAEAAPILDLDRHFREEMERTAKETEEMAREAQDRLGVPSASPAEEREAMERLARRLGAAEERYEEKVEVPLEELERVYRLLEDAARFTALALAQDDLARRARRWGNLERAETSEERQAMEGLAEEQRALEEELRDVLQSIRDHAARLPDKETYRELREEAEAFATAVLDAKAPEALATSGRSFGEGAGKRGAAESRAAADILLSFLSRCNGMGKQGRAALKFQPGLSSGLGNTIDDLLGAAGLPSNGSGAQGLGAAGGGASSRRGTLDNVALYGKSPSQGGGGKGRPGGKQGGPGGPGRAGGTPGEGPAADPRTDLIYGGVPIEAVPGEYRSAVRDYFRRIAEESGNEKR